MNITMVNYIHNQLPTHRHTHTDRLSTSFVTCLRELSHSASLRPAYFSHFSCVPWGCTEISLHRVDILCSPLPPSYYFLPCTAHLSSTSAEDVGRLTAVRVSLQEGKLLHSVSCVMPNLLWPGYLCNATHFFLRTIS